MKNVLQRLFTKNEQKESVYFYTFHKCASSLFAKYILKNCEGLVHQDYAKGIYLGDIKDMALNYKSNGEIYGPIRLSADPKSLVYQHVVKPVSNVDFVKGKKQLFFIRDPRDILISAYYSYGFTHGMSPVQKISEQQQVTRDAISEQSLEDYILSETDNQIRHFKWLHELAAVNPDSVIIKYEDLIERFDFFISQLDTHIDLKKSVKKEIYKRSRPIIKENTNSHRRSGGVRSFEDKLDKKTIQALNEKLQETLTLFDYKI